MHLGSPSPSPPPHTPVTVYTLRSTTSLYSDWIIERRSLNWPMQSLSFFLRPAVMVVRVRSLALPSPDPFFFLDASFSLSRASSLLFTACASLLTELILSCAHAGGGLEAWRGGAGGVRVGWGGGAKAGAACKVAGQGYIYVLAF